MYWGFYCSNLQHGSSASRSAALPTSFPPPATRPIPGDSRVAGGEGEGYFAGLCSAFSYRYRMERSKGRKKQKTPWGFKTPVRTSKTPPRISLWNEAKQRSCNALTNMTYILQHLRVPNQAQDKPLLFSSSPKTVSTLDARWGTID